jgi:hypothetical protein
LCPSGYRVSAAEEQTIRIDDFSAGLVTIVAPHKIPVGGARLAHNVDFSKYPMEMTTRDGYTQLNRLYGIDSFLWNGIYSMAWNDDRRELLLVADSATVGYSNIYSSAYNSLNFAIIEDVGVKCDWDAAYAEMVDNGFVTECFPDTCGYFSMILYLDWVNVLTGHRVNETVTTYGHVDTMTDATLADRLRDIVDSMNTANFSPFVVTLPASDSVNVQDTSAYISFNDFTFAGFHYTVGTWDGKKWIYSPAVSYTGVTITRTGSLIPTPDKAKRIATRFPATGRPSFAAIGNRLYIGSTAGRGVVYDGQRTSVWPELSPGELFVMPILSDTLTAGQKGRYRYMVEFDNYAERDTLDSLFLNLPGCISKPVVSDNEPIMLTNWPPPPLHHSLMDATKDSVRYKLFRTVGDYGRLSNYDTLFYVDDLSFPVGDDGLTGVDSLFTFTYVDTFSDGTIRANALSDTTRWRMAVDSGWYQWSPQNNDYRATEQWWHPGGVVILQSDSTTAADNYGIWENNDTIIDWTACLGYAYTAVFVDTSTMSRSDSGRSVCLLQDAKVVGHRVDTLADGRQLDFARIDVEKVQLELPRAPGNESSRMCLLFRSPIRPFRPDTVGFDTSYFSLNPLSGALFVGYEVTPRVLAGGTYRDLYRFLGAYAPGDTVWDSLGYDSLMSRDVFIINNAPPYVESMTAVDGRLFAVSDNYLSIGRTRDTSAIAFDVLDRINISGDDGDRVTSIWPARKSARIAKNKSIYTAVNQTVAGFSGYRDLEYTNAYGCVTSGSVQRTPYGYTFLSEEGVRLDGEDQYKAYAFQANLVSSQLRNFGDMTAEQRRKCESIYHDYKYLLSFPDLDTTFVLNFIRGPKVGFAWSTWGFTFIGAARHSSASVSDFFIPADTLFFIKSNDPYLYRYGNTDLDDNAYVPFFWWSGYMNQIDGFEYQVGDFGLHVIATDSAYLSTQVIFENEMDIGAGAEVYKFPRLDTLRYQYFEQLTSTEALAWSILFRTNSLSSSVSSTRRNGEIRLIGFDLNMIKRNKYRSQ